MIDFKFDLDRFIQNKYKQYLSLLKFCNHKNKENNQLIEHLSKVILGFSFSKLFD